jgi:hypothetical protein
MNRLLRIPRVIAIVAIIVTLGITVRVLNAAGPAADYIVGTTLITTTVLPHPPEPPPGIPSLEPFWDSAHHWRDVGNTGARAKPSDKVISPRPDLGSYAPAQYDQVAANVLMFQNKNGGWAKNYDMYAAYNDAEKAQVRAGIDNVATTFDNESTH